MKKTNHALNHKSGFWVVALAFLLSMAYSTVPTPLYLIYQREDGFGTYMITIIFAAYAVGVVLSLYFAGHVSDWLGRRRIILIATFAEAISALLFLLWHGVAALIIARLVSGLGIGAITATATAHLSELRMVSHPHEKGTRSALVATIVNTGGLALGPIASGLLAQYISRPLFVPYAIFVLLLLLSATAVSLVPETVEPREDRPAYRPQRLSTAGANGRGLAAAAIGVISAFAILGMFTSLSPSFVAGTMHDSSRLTAGLVSGSVFAAATLAQIIFARAQRRTQLIAGIGAMSLGLILVSGGMLLGNIAVFLSASVSSGAGTGLILRSSIATASSTAAPSSRGAVLAFIFLMGYTGLAIPVIGLGVALIFLPSRVALILFASIILALVLWSGSRMLRPASLLEERTTAKAA